MAFLLAIFVYLLIVVIGGTIVWKIAFRDQEKHKKPNINRYVDKLIGSLVVIFILYLMFKK